jgi:uncharacterized cupredoxin-like copper-binding protein
LFALVSSFVLPRRDPNFPGRNLFWFVAASAALFLAMLTAVFVFGKESEEGHEAEPAAAEASAGPELAALKVSETEFKIHVPAAKVGAGTVDIQVTNDGTVPHNLVVEGPGVDKSTPEIGPGKEASLQVDLKPGAYELYCSIPGHRDAGMQTKLTVS